MKKKDIRIVMEMMTDDPAADTKRLHAQVVEAWTRLHPGCRLSKERARELLTWAFAQLPWVERDRLILRGDASQWVSKGGAASLLGKHSYLKGCVGYDRAGIKPRQIEGRNYYRASDILALRAKLDKDGGPKAVAVRPTAWEILLGEDSI